jgi:hypothetical protein
MSLQTLLILYGLVLALLLLGLIGVLVWWAKNRLNMSRLAKCQT